LKAIKVVSKEHIEKYEKHAAVLREKEILMRLSEHPNLIRLEQTF
jgi:serine/threonine protein kinase